MVREELFKFITAADAAKTSSTLVNQNCDVLSLQVSGTATACTIKVQGKADAINGEWVTLTVIDLAALAPVNVIEANGIYEAGVEGLTQVRVVVESVSGGVVNVFGVLANTGI